MPNGNTLYIAYFDAGLQKYDITDAHLPTNTGYFIPPERADLPKHATGGPQMTTSGESGSRATPIILGNPNPRRRIREATLGFRRWKK
jgi:hypothetical protein